MIDCRRPENVDELLETLDSGKFRIFAGGTDLMVRKRQWQGAERRFEEDIVFIEQIDELKGITEDKEHYHIKTCTTHSSMEKSLVLPECIRLPYRLMGNPAIRNVATVGGNIVNAAQVADSLPLLYAMDGKILLKSKNGSRILPMDEFIKGKYRTEIRGNEFLYEVIIPKLNIRGFRYKKVGSRKASILSKFSVVFLYGMDGVNLEYIRVAIGAVNETPVRNRDAEEKFVENRDVGEFLTAIRKDLHGSDDKRSTRLYREEASLRIVAEYLNELLRGDSYE
ncbi:CO or xanthine dehydrogenase, FAD-binding subunit [Dethiosulfatibacter aminovorans DSM 17477]|uniref:CO or xanthine dehydrogenase, FAD-binding subunit n=1 Tax=Dethiosulfatibacter aminovorans DSM 17477 TaxID=1121476 RepID=A0A1M6HC46_9FIRM|nr:FAD binding domain-containing protein [Dethiosulfatibacter aminovorans]SHJ19704.1 CO or xanthine dehydrogenase, FAD-binding subunit [Dethiosulfatibacter aminovorans DSM 17477]